MTYSKTINPHKTGKFMLDAVAPLFSCSKKALWSLSNEMLILIRDHSYSLICNLVGSLVGIFRNPEQRGHNSVNTSYPRSRG